MIRRHWLKIKNFVSFLFSDLQLFPMTKVKVGPRLIGAAAPESLSGMGGSHQGEAASDHPWILPRGAESGIEGYGLPHFGFIIISER